MMTQCMGQKISEYPLSLCTAHDATYNHVNIVLLIVKTTMEEPCLKVTVSHMLYI